MSIEALTPEVLCSGKTLARRFDSRWAAPSSIRSVSEATRRAYSRAVRKFFQFASMKHLTEVVPQDVLLWRDPLRSQKKSVATVSFKLSNVCSFFEYLKAAGAIPLNPASTKLILPPELPSEPTGRALQRRRYATYSRGLTEGRRKGRGATP